MNSSINTFNPLEESPQADSEPSDVACIEKVTNALVEQLNLALKEKTLHRIALFGGFGQGKTSALIQAIKKLETNRTVDYWFFNVSSYKADQLEFEFDRMIKAKTILTPIKVITIPIVITTTFFLVFIPQAEIILQTDAIRYSIGIVFSGILGYITHGFKEDISYWRTNYKKLFYQQNKLRKQIKGLFKKPKIIIIDDLDRATIAQQRAILRTLYKEKEELNFVFVVCMDETKLLESSADPDDPSELLRKSIDFELRLPTRLPQDAVLLSQEIIKQAIRKNNTFRALLLDPIFSSDFATVLSLLSNFSPRIAKRLLNNAILHAEQLQVLAHTEDCTALLKLHMLYFTFPLLRSFPHELIILLEERNESDIILALENIPITEHKQLNRFLLASQGIQPLDGNWRRLFANHSHNHDDQIKQQKNFIIDDNFLVKDKNIHRRLWESLLSIKNHHNVREFGGLIDYLRKTSTSTKDDEYYRIWMTLQVMLAHTILPIQRFTLIIVFEQYLNSSSDDSDIKKRIHYALWRYCFSDHEVYKLMIAENEIQGNPIFFKHIKEKLVDNHLSLSLALAKIITKNSDLYEIFYKRLLNPSSNTSLILEQIKNNKILLGALWFPLTSVTNDLDWVKPLKNQLILFNLYENQLTQTPNSLEHWFLYTANKEKIIQDRNSVELLECLEVLLYNNYWSLQAWHKLFNDPQYKFITDLINSITDISFLSDNSWFTALLLICDLNYDAGSDEFKIVIKDSLKKLLGSVKLLNTPQLTKTLLDVLNRNSRTLLHVADSSQLYKLFDSLKIPPNDEWKELKLDYEIILKRLFDGHSEEENILATFDLL